VTSTTWGAAGAGAGVPQAANKKLAITEITKRLETNFLIDMIFFLLRMNGVKVGNNTVGLIGIRWRYICNLTPPQGESDKTSYDDFFAIIPVTLPVMLPELYNDFYLITIGVG
jgi:hypothetical protein